MTETELHAIENRIITAIKEQTHESIKDTGKTWVTEASAAAVEATFIKLGLDCKQPFEAQKDFAYLRQSRSDSEDRRKIITQTITKWGLAIFLSAAAAGASTWAVIQNKP